MIACHRGHPARNLRPHSNLELGPSQSTKNLAPSKVLAFSQILHHIQNSALSLQISSCTWSPVPCRSPPTQFSIKVPVEQWNSLPLHICNAEHYTLVSLKTHPQTLHFRRVAWNSTWDSRRVGHCTRLEMSHQQKTQVLVNRIYQVYENKLNY